MDLLTCVNFPTHLRRAIHTQTLCLGAQCVLCDGLCNGVAAILGNHRAADGRQHVFSISPLPAGSTPKFSSSGQFPKSPLTLFHCCNRGSSHFCSVSFWVTCHCCWHTTYKLPSRAKHFVHCSLQSSEVCRFCYYVRVMPPTSNVYCIPESFCYLVCNEDGPMPLPRVNKGVLRLCLESLDVLRRTLESLQVHTNCHHDFWNCFSPRTILLYITHLQECIFKIAT